MTPEVREDPGADLLDRFERKVEQLLGQQEAMGAIMPMVPWPDRLQIAAVCGELATMAREPNVPTWRVLAATEAVISMNESMLRRYSS